MSKKLAVVVEDDSDLVVIFTEALKAAGFEVQAVTDGLAAMECFRETVPHVLVLDLHLPGMSGIEIFKNLRKDPRFEQTRILIATADDSLAEQMENEADLVLQKPISFNQLKQLASRLGGG